MKKPGKKAVNYKVFLAVLALLAGAGATFAALKPEAFRAGVSSTVEWMKFDMLAAAAEQSSKGPESRAPAPPSEVSSAPAPSAPSSSPQARSESSGPPAPSEPEAVKVSLQQAAKPLKAEVSLKDQKVLILDAEDRTVQEYVCSSGEKGSETPTGTFTITDRGKSFYNPKVKEGAYYWTRFYKTYLFHSLPFGENEKPEPEEAAKLGTPASHGCVRLELEDAKWIYDNLPVGTEVTIY